jgi:hypothetical protein
MTTPLVLLGLAIVAGAVAWVLSARPSRPRTSWTPSHAAHAPANPSVVDFTEQETQAPVAVPAAESFAYVPLGVTDGLTARTRLFGVAGLIALIVLTSAAVALGVLLLGHAIGLQFSHFATSGGGASTP